MQEDTYAGQQSDPLSLNLYTYCHNSPLLYFDPTGHYAQTSQGIQAEIDRLYEHGTHSAGLWSQINALEAAKERAYEDESITRNAKAYRESISHLPREAKDLLIDQYCRYKDGESFTDWQKKQFKPELVDSSNHFLIGALDAIRRCEEISDRTNYAKQRLETVKSEMPGNSVNKAVIPDQELIVEVFAYTKMDKDQEDFFWDLIPWLGTDYKQVVNPTCQGYVDCAGLARAAYEERNIIISMSGKGTAYSLRMSGSTESSMREYQIYTNIINKYYKSDKKQFNLEYDYSESVNECHNPLLDYTGDTYFYDRETMNKKRYDGMTITAGVVVSGEEETGDVVYHDCNGDGVVDHALMVFGNDRYGRTIYIETAQNPEGVRILGPDNTYGTSGVQHGADRYDRRQESVVVTMRYLN
ncbi:MAG: hypothetical protein PHP22_08480 [Oscillospiraceae bacterium]|nr:hypothetical protein [Oscillospiraceae bacterium]